jgi:hypothetical protein
MTFLALIICFIMFFAKDSYQPGMFDSMFYIIVTGLVLDIYAWSVCTRAAHNKENDK